MSGPRLAFARGSTTPCCFFNVVVMTLNGSKQTQLTNEPGYNARPDWSHDGRRIVYGACRESDGNCEVYVMNTDGSSKTNLTNTFWAFDGNPAWSPDDKKIVFVSDRDGNQEIYVMNADGSDQIRLTFNDVYDQQPSWSPDGTKIAFQSERDGNNEIYVMNTDGSGQVNLTHNAASDDRPRWSPRGDKIAFDANRSGHVAIYVMGTDGSAQTRLTNNSRDDYGPAWSPNGNQIAFARQVDDNVNFDIYTMNADGSSPTAVTSGPDWDADPAWTTGGSTTPTTQLHFVANGDFANYNWFAFDPAGGYSYGQVSANRGGPTNAPQTFLYYFVYQCDPSTCTSGYGYGLIPNGDLTGGRTSQRLNTNTTGNPDFFTFEGPTGVVAVDWRPNGLYTSSFSGTNQYTLPGFSLRSQGDYAQASATATGSIVGIPLSPDGSGDLGTNHQTNIYITRSNAVALGAWMFGTDGSAPTPLMWGGNSIPLWTIGTTNAATQFHFVSNGDFGNVIWFDANTPAGGFTYGQLYVNRGGPTNAPQTAMSYFVYQCDPSLGCGTILDGYGLIPNGDLSGGATSLRLSTNTTGNPYFSTFAGPTGVVSVDWRPNGISTSSSSGISQYSFPGFTQRSQGNWNSASAHATGSIIGVPISPNDSSGIGTNHQVTIDIAH